jgi:WD40 repeat protein
VALNANGSMLAVGASDARINAQFRRVSSEASIYIVNPSTGELLQSPLKGHRKAIIDLAFSSTGMLASASDDGTVLLWDLSKQSFVTVSSGSEGALAVEFSPDGRLLAFAQAHGPAGIWDVGQGRLLWRSETDIAAIAFSPDGVQLAMGTAKGEVRLRAVREGTERTVLRLTSGGGIDRLKYDRSGGRLLALIDGNLSVINVENQSATSWLSAGERVRDFAIGPTSVLLLHASSRLSLWNLGSGEGIADLQRASGLIPVPQSVAVSASDDHIAATQSSGIWIFNLANAAIESRACDVAGGSLTPAEWAALVQTPYTAICPDH